MDRKALAIEKLGKSFNGRRVLSNINLVVEAGECLALVGPSGCGKTTLLRLIAGLEDADAGCIQINGELASNPHVLLPPNRRRIGLVFQDLALWPHMQAWENVEFMLPSALSGRSLRRDRAIELLGAVRVDGLHTNYPHQLSRGQQQRVALARALAAEPSMLLLDEPFASQDPKLKMQMVELIQEIRESKQITMVYVSHTLDEIPRLADRVATLSNGRIHEVLTLEAFIRSSSP